MGLTPEQIADQLAAAGHGYAVIMELEPMRNDRSPAGKLFHARDRMRKIWEGRLRGAQLQKPVNSKLFGMCEALLKGLENVGDDETIHSWQGMLDGKTRAGFSTEKRFVFVFPEWYGESGE